MKQFMTTLKTAFLLAASFIFFSSSHVLADDIEIYGTGNASSPPVNVMFIFDMSGSMLLTPDGEPTSNGSGLSRKEILLEALTNVLNENKEKETLRVGFTWFNTWSQGINYPATSISADLHDLDSDVPANEFFVFSQIPRQLEKVWVNNSYKTNIVGSLYETAKYYRGDEVSGWSGYKPPQWSNGYYNNQYSPHALSYIPNPGPTAWTQEGQKSWGSCDYDFGSSSTCKPSYTSYPDRLQVNNCRFDYSMSCSDWHCNNAGTESESCYCRSYTPANKHICDYEYWAPEWLGADYRSPIENSCQASYIVLLSDGEPTNFYHEWQIENQIINTECADISGLESGKCGPELVEYLANNDQRPNISGSKVFTYTIGFNVAGLGKTYLETLAEKGKGQFYSASDASDLESAFEQILESITGENESFSSIATTINAKTLSSHNRVFLNMFKPGPTRSWQGNTKGYFLSTDGLLDVDGDPAVALDTEDNIDKFSDGSRSFWSSHSDGNNVEQGGAAEKISSNSSRKIYTYTAQTPPNRSSLTQISTTETDITVEMMGASDASEKEELIDWLLHDANMGDPLHSKPLLISYEGNGGAQSTQDVLFTMTNQGLMHAFNASSPTSYGDYNGGNELFAFIPQALLPQLKDHKANINSPEHLYGLDGVMSYYHNDTNHDRIVNNSEKVYLYFGMRRGGRNYYALDISDPNAPIFQWRIEGGMGDYTALGQTWSRLTPTKIKWDSTSEKKVLIFGGGYDETQDNHTERTADAHGNAVFIADALTGERLLYATKGTGNVDPGNKMEYGIPGDIRVIDTNYDNLADRLYFGDMGGQIWRINLTDSNNNRSMKGRLFAELAENSSEEAIRRFYNPPEVAKMKDATGFFYTVAMASGFRAHPTSTKVKDKVYVLRDEGVLLGSESTSGGTITQAQILDVTNTIDKEEIKTSLVGKKGWSLDLELLGEKSLSPLLIFNSQLAFTTFTPANEGATSLTCGGGGGDGRYYLINLNDGTPVRTSSSDPNNSAEQTISDRWSRIPGKGIPPKVVRIFGNDGKETQEAVGKTIVGNTAEKIHRINWKEID